MRQKTFAKRAGSEAVIWIDPTRIHHFAGSRWPVSRQRTQRYASRYPAPLVRLVRPLIKMREPFVIPQSAFGTPQPIDTVTSYVKVADFIANMNTVESTLWYRQLSEDLATKGRALYKGRNMESQDAIKAFLTGYATDLVISLRAKGYDDPNGHVEATGVIDANGNICKTASGNHRFAICRVLGVERYPLRIIGIHEAYVAKELGASNISMEAAISLIRHAEQRVR